MDTTLPSKLLDPLPIIPPWLFPLIKWIVILVIIGIVLGFFIYKLLKRERDIPEYIIPQNSGDLEFGKEKYNEILDKINQIKVKYTKSKLFRDGLHELSSILKTYLEKATGIQVEEMTSKEIDSNLENKNISSLFYKMSILQFGRQEPEEQEFVSIIDDSNKTIKDFKSYLRNERTRN